MPISYHGGDGLRLFSCYEDPRISDCLITYNKQTGLNLIGRHDIVVSANQFEENHDALRCTDGFNLCMTGNNFSNSYIGEGKVRRGTKDLDAAGITLEGTSDVSISGNVFSGLRPKALIVKGQPSRRVVFTGNVLTDATGEAKKLVGSVVEGNVVE